MPRSFVHADLIFVQNISRERCATVPRPVLHFVQGPLAGFLTARIQVLSPCHSTNPVPYNRFHPYSQPLHEQRGLVPTRHCELA